MKQITLWSKILFLLLIFLFSIEGSSQSQFNTVISGGSTSSFGRAPQGERAVTRSVFIVTAAEMTAGGFNSGDQISGLGFSYETAQNIPTTGTIKIYLQNTTAVTNTKGTNWPTVISGMTLASDATTTVPAAVGDYNIEFSNGATFTYSGGSLFVAYDYQNLSNPVATTNNVAFCDNSPVGGAPGIFSARSAAGSTAIPTTLSGSNFRPQVRLGVPVACARPTNLGARNLTATSADLTWTTNGGIGVEIEYGLQGFSLGNGTTFNGATVISPYTVPNLTANTVYDYYIRTECSGSFSNWNGPFTFTSLFLPSNLPYNTGFENDEFNYYGWKAERDPSGTVGNFWQSVNFGVGDPNVQEGAYSARVGAGVTIDQANDWIISRGINLNANQMVDISFYTAVAQTGSTVPARYNLTVGTAQNASAQSTTIVNSPGFSNPLFQLNTHSYTAPSTGVYYFGIQNAILANAAGSVFWALDNFTISSATASIINDETSSFKIYPNPTNGMIRINSDVNPINQLSIIDIHGRQVMHKSYERVLTAPLDISELSTGMYMIRISSSEGTVMKKLLKN